MPITGLGLPYMGSKRKLAPKILTYILKNNPKAKYFYDLKHFKESYDILL